MSKESVIDLIDAGDEKDLIRKLHAGEFDKSELNAIDEDDFTPLLLAVSIGSAKLCAALLASGADPFFITNEGNTLLHAAAISNRCSDVSDQLVICGVDLTVRNHKGQSAIGIATFKNNSAFLKAAERYELTIYNLMLKHQIEHQHAMRKFDTSSTEIEQSSPATHADETPPEFAAILPDIVESRVDDVTPPVVGEQSVSADSSA